MLTLHMLKGLPGSGKTTVARKLCDEKGWARVNKDDLRSMLHNGKWSKGNEKQVIAIRDAIIVDSLDRGVSIVVDDTNFEPKHLERLTILARLKGAIVTTDFIDTPVDVCIKRDLARPNSVGSKVIWDMYNKYLKPEPVVYIPPAGEPPAIICDIDGTLAHMSGRSPYEWDKVGEDIYDEVVGDILRRYADLYEIILVSGRDGSCLQQTVDWLTRHDVHYGTLLMRQPGDMRQDTVVKRELFEDCIRNFYDVRFVLDDRDSVVRMWRDEVGLKVLQVADGDF